MNVEFTKMHGLGNDFMVIDGIKQTVKLQAAEIQALSKRDTGIGFDQCLLVEKPRDAHSDFFYRIFNADGQEVGQCGNGARCLARFVVYAGLTQKKRITVTTKTTSMQLKINADETVTVAMAPPLFAPADIPFSVSSQQNEYLLPLAEQDSIPIHVLNVGNPHAVTLVQDLASTPVDTLGEMISLHPLFPEEVNAGFMEILSSDSLRLRVYERGCGETKACGSGAVAAAIIGRLFYAMAQKIQVELPGGKLVIEWQGRGEPIFLTGPASFVYTGKVLYSF